MRVAGLICDLRHLKFVHLSERKGVCDANALKFVILRVTNALNSGFLAFSKALSAKSATNSACGITSQSVLLGRNGAWQGVVNLATHNTAWRSEFDNETAQRGTTNSTNSATQHSKHSEFSMASTTRQIQCEENGAVLVGEAGKAKMEQYLGGGLLSLVAGTFWQAFGLNLKDFFVHSRAKLNACFVI